jgi:hypothetical protein
MPVVEAVRCDSYFRVYCKCHLLLKLSPPPTDLASQTDQVFLTLYREVSIQQFPRLPSQLTPPTLPSRQLYFRHVYAKLEPNVDDRFQSYENICELFNLLLSECASAVWDMGAVLKTVIMSFRLRAAGSS